MGQWLGRKKTYHQIVKLTIQVGKGSSNMIAEGEHKEFRGVVNDVYFMGIVSYVLRLFTSTGATIFHRQFYFFEILLHTDLSNKLYKLL